jgi:hypothetical protein
MTPTPNCGNDYGQRVGKSIWNIMQNKYIVLKVISGINGLAASYLILAYTGFLFNIAKMQPLAFVTYLSVLIASWGLFVFSIIDSQKTDKCLSDVFSKSTRIEVWFVVFLFWVQMLALGYTISGTIDNPYLISPFLMWATLVGLGVAALKEHHHQPDNASESPSIVTPRIKPIVIGGLFAVILWVRDFFLLWGFSYHISGDSYEYIYLGSVILNRSIPLEGVISNIYAVSYPLLNMLTNSDANLYLLLCLQIIIGGLSVGAMVYALARRKISLSILVGVLFSLDILWGSINRLVQTESLFMNSLILSIAVVLIHFERREQTSIKELIAAGVLFGWTFIIRPAGVYLFFLVPPLYLWLTRSWKKAAFTTVSLLAVFFCVGLFNLWRVGTFRLYGQGGAYMAWPLFTYQILDSENGPASYTLISEIEACAGSIDTKGYYKNEVVDDFFDVFVPCLAEAGHSEDEIADLFGTAYIEGIRQHPIRYGSALLYEGSAYLTYPTMQLSVFQLGTGQGIWGDSVYIPEPRFEADTPAINTVANILTYINKSFLLFAPRRGNEQTIADIFAWFMFSGFLLITTRGRDRFLVVMCLLVIHYMAFATVAGHIFLPRYTIVLSPFYNILTALFVVTAADELHPAVWIRQIKNGIERYGRGQQLTS